MSGLFRRKTQSISDPRLNAIQVNQSAYGNAISLVYGKTRIPMTLGWYNNFIATPHTETQKSGKGGGATSSHTSYTYSAALIGILCEGQINGVGTVWSDKQQVALASLGFTLFAGGGGQATWSYLTTNYPAQAIPYDHTAYVAASTFQLGDSAGLPNLSFEVKALLPFSAGTIDDAEASDVLINYCTDANHGAGFNFLDSGLQGVGVTTWQSYCIAMGFFFSPAESSQRAAVEFIDELMRMTNSAPVWSPGIGLRVVPYADQSVTGNGRTYTPDLTPIFAFTDDDYCPREGEEPVKVTRKAPSETFNIVRIEFLDRSNQYNTAVAEAKDENDIRLNGERAMTTINLHGITIATIARQVAQLILQRQLYIRNEFTFRVRADYSLLEPMDLVSITDTGLGIDNQLVRIIQTEDDEEDFFEITAEEMLVGTASAPLYDWQAAQGYAANYAASPGSISTPLIFTVPPFLIDINGGYQLAIAVSGASASWGGCDVYWSVDNVFFFYAGTIYGPARYGTLATTLATGSDPDSINTLSVQLANTALTMDSGSLADADNLRTLIYVDGEIMSYETATLVGAGHYNLTYLRRGKYGSAIGSHTSGTSWARFDNALFRIPFDAGQIGQTIYFKFPSFNIYGIAAEDIASVPNYSKTLAAANAGQNLPGNATFVARGNCVVVGDKIFKGGGASAYDSDCYSIEAFSGGCIVKFRSAKTTGRFLAGLNSDPLTDQSYASLDYAWFADPAGVAEIYRSSTQVVANAGSYTAATVFSITYDGNVVRFYLDGILKYEDPAPGKVFFFDSSFYDPGSTLTNLYFGPLSSQPTSRLIARGNCIVVGNSIQKQGGINNWDSDCYSAETFPNGCQVSFRAADTASLFMIGLNTDPTTDQSYTSIDYAMYCTGTGGSAGLYAYESSVGTNLVVTYSTSDVLKVNYDGQWVRYYKNSTLLRSIFDPGKSFYMDSSFDTPGAIALDVSFGPLTSVTPSPFIARGNCKVSDTNVIKQGGSADRSSDFYSIIGYPVCHVSFKANDSPSTADPVVGLSTNPTASTNYTNINYCFDVSNSAGTKTWQVTESGTGTGVTGTWTASTLFAITYDGSTVTYYVDGVSVKTTAVSGLTLFAQGSIAYPGEGINSLRFGPTTNLAVADTAQLGINAATELYQDTTNFGGTGYGVGTQTVHSFNVTPTADCTVEFTGFIVADNVLPDSGNSLTWYVTPAGGSATAIAGAPSVSTSKQSFPFATSFVATGGVQLTFDLKTTVSGSSIHLYDSSTRVTVIKK